MRGFCRLAASALLLAGCAFGSSIDGGFEEGSLAGWSFIGDASASVSVDCADEGAGVLDPDSGDFSARLISMGATAEEIAMQMGISLETLQNSNATTDFPAGTPAPIDSLNWQTVTVNGGDFLQFRWNFVERDYLPYDDWAFYGIAFEGGPAELTMFASLGSVGPDDGATINGWETLTVNITQSGTYTFYFGVANAFDEEGESDLRLDGSYSGDSPPEPNGAISESGTWVSIASGLGLLALRSRFRKSS